jgi:hypothetical protein
MKMGLDNPVFRVISDKNKFNFGHFSLRLLAIIVVHNGKFVNTLREKTERENIGKA